MRNYFIGWSQEKLEKALQRVQQEIANGTRVTSWGSGDTNVSKSQSVSPEETYDRILYALYLLDPTTYPLSSIRRQTVTVARFANLK